MSALTDLENYVYNSRNIMSSEEFKSNVTESDCKIVNDIVNDMLDWIDENRNESGEVFKEKIKELKDIVSPIFMKSYGQK
jgi:hypothetical protein